MGTWGPGGSAEGQLEAARAAALEAVACCCSNKDEARKASAKVRSVDTHACTAQTHTSVVCALLRCLHPACKKHLPRCVVWTHMHSYCRVPGCCVSYERLSDVDAPQRGKLYIVCAFLRQWRAAAATKMRHTRHQPRCGVWTLLVEAVTHARHTYVECARHTYVECARHTYVECARHTYVECARHTYVECARLHCLPSACKASAKVRSVDTFAYTSGCQVVAL
jgi:hypothetical protein